MEFLLTFRTSFVITLLSSGFPYTITSKLLQSFSLAMSK